MLLAAYLAAIVHGELVNGSEAGLARMCGLLCILFLCLVISNSLASKFLVLEGLLAKLC